jgi:uncharacterized protein (DUF2461 family)
VHHAHLSRSALLKRQIPIQNKPGRLDPARRQEVAASFVLPPRGTSRQIDHRRRPESSQITKFRDAIGRDARRYKAIVNDKSFKGYFGDIRGDTLKTAPQGFARDHPEIELLRLKEVVAIHLLKDEMVLSPKFSEHVLKVFIAMKPFLDYLNSVME